MKIPKRRKRKDNPYTILFDEKKHIYRVQFIYNRKKQVDILITEGVYNIFNEFELQDLREMNEYDNHIEHSQLCESTLYKKMFKKNIESIEEIIIKKDNYELLYNAIQKLKKIQRERIIMHFFENLTLEEIARKEGCTKVAVKYSIDRALINLKIIIKKNVD